MADYLLNTKTRNITCTVDYQNALGQHATGYPKEYRITGGFIASDIGIVGTGGTDRAPDPNAVVSYPAITNATLARMSETAYNTRLSAFYRFISAENDGLNPTTHLVPGYEPTGTNPVNCPLNQEGSDTPTIF